MRLNPNLYPEVTYENSPQQVEVELKLVKWYDRERKKRSLHRKDYIKTK
jgi:hypothetical protein